jgi:hypothetical protein
MRLSVRVHIIRKSTASRMSPLYIRSQPVVSKRAKINRDVKYMCKVTILLYYVVNILHDIQAGSQLLTSRHKCYTTTYPKCGYRQF